MDKAPRNPMSWLRGLAWAVLALMLLAALYSAWITVTNYHRIGV